MEKAAQKAAKSILDAKVTLEHEEKNINSLLGGMDDIDVGPRCPKLPDAVRSMNSRDFALAALTQAGAKLLPQPGGLYLSKIETRHELIRFNNQTEGGTASVLYAPGSAPFDRLVTKIISKKLHKVQDIDKNPLAQTEKNAQDWVNSFTGKFEKFRLEEVRRCYTGNALMRVRATVAHDSYERLVEVPCSPKEHSHKVNSAGLEPIQDFIDSPFFSIGLHNQTLIERATLDSGIGEFCRFYTERMVEEIKGAGDDPRKKKKLEDEFTPRLVIDLSGLEGTVHRQLKVSVSYKLQSEKKYVSTLSIIPSTGEIVDAPEMAKCDKTGRTVPEECIGKCEISGLRVLQDLLVQSEISEREALPEYLVKCSLTGKHILNDEAEKSFVTGHLVTSNLLKTSEINGKRAEPQFFSKCEFTSVDALETELAVSQVSGKRYRADEELRSVVSGKAGHKQEFILCAETSQPLLAMEAEKCEVTGKIVKPGILEKCEEIEKNVLPSELEKCAATGKRALKKLLVSSSLSGARILERVAISSVTGKFCAPLEARQCLWSGRKCHPDDLRTCELTGISMYFEYATSDSRLEPLVKLLDGVERKSAEVDLWDNIANNASVVIGKKNCKVEVADLSPDKRHLALSLEVQSWMGLKRQQSGLLYSVMDKTVIGRIVLGKRGTKGWIQSK
jgi:hypothetical protein